jgi:hypothetical protein
LRWNNAGVVGGRALQDLLKMNQTLFEVLVTGNDIPEDIELSIGNEWDFIDQ